MCRSLQSRICRYYVQNRRGTPLLHQRHLNSHYFRHSLLGTSYEARPSRTSLSQWVMAENAQFPTLLTANIFLFLDQVSLLCICNWGKSIYLFLCMFHFHVLAHLLAARFFMTLALIACVLSAILSLIGLLQHKYKWLFAATAAYAAQGGYSWNEHLTMTAIGSQWS